MSSSSGITSAAWWRPGNAAITAARVGHVLFRTRDAVIPLVLLAAAFGTRPHVVGSVHTDHLVDAVGVSVSLAGQAIRILVIGLVYITRGGQNRRIWANSLVDDGIFAHCRNPMYVGNLLLVLGLAIVHNGWAMYLVVLPLYVLTYVCIVSAEEEYLHSRFGDAYVDYCRRVPRWIPSLRGLPATLRATRFDWLKVLRKEYGTPFAWVSGLLLLLLWEHQGPSDAPISPLEFRLIVAAWIVAAAAYSTVRRLKHSGRLGMG
jgi:protein-S-isoprenylcysteine O-methyltransferase Ste14